MIDLNTRFANVEQTFANNSLQARRRAASLAQSRADPMNREIEDTFSAPIAEAEADAARWEARRLAAAKGFFLATPDDLNDAGYLSDFGDLMAEAGQANRVVYKETSEGDDLQRAGTGGGS